jgi:hypothetical protein
VSADSLRWPFAIESGRFALVSYLPTYAAASYLLVLIWAGAPSPRLRFADAWRTAAHLGVGEILLLLVVVSLVAIVLHPVQLSLVRLLEGYWPAWWRPVSRLGLHRQSRARQRLREATELPRGKPPSVAATRTAGLAETALRRRFPSIDQLLRPTRLGNVLASAEDRAGSAYGWDTPVVWPRLYSLLGAEVKSIVDDRRNVLDVLCRLSIVGVGCAVVSLGLLARAGYWAFLVIVPILLAMTAYRAAVQAAYAYAEAIRVAFDLHRFDLYPALHLAVPVDPTAERAMNESLCAWWRQGAEPNWPYTHGQPGLGTQDADEH